MQMEKLIELLNEYSKNIWYFNEEDLQWQTKAWILSKEFWWVKWLVENDKIDTDIVYEKWFLAKTYDKDEVWEYFEPYEEILMLLSIQDEPINFLISILK